MHLDPDLGGLAAESTESTDSTSAESQSLGIAASLLMVPQPLLLVPLNPLLAPLMPIMGKLLQMVVVIQGSQLVNRLDPMHNLLLPIRTFDGD